MMHWCIGALVHWRIGALEHGCIGALAHWCTGALVHWCIGALVHWCIARWRASAKTAPPSRCPRAPGLPRNQLVSQCFPSSVALKNALLVRIRVRVGVRIRVWVRVRVRVNALSMAGPKRVCSRPTTPRPVIVRPGERVGLFAWLTCSSGVRAPCGILARLRHARIVSPRLPARLPSHVPPRTAHRPHWGPRLRRLDG